MPQKINTRIEINDNNTEQTGTYKVYYKDLKGNQQMKILSESAIDSLLNMRQKESFFIGKHKFTIESEYDFKNTFLSY